MDNYKEKYEQALEKAKQLCAYPTTQPFVNDLQDIFPELAETEIEDERIKKALIEFVHDTTGDELWVDYDVHKEDAIAWLEKQGEQKPILDVEIPFGAKDSELQEATYYIPKGFHAEIEDDKVVIKKGEQKPVEWSEEDEEIRNKLIDVFEGIVTKGLTANLTFRQIQEFIGWLKSLKDRVQPQPKQEWSEEDEAMFRSILTDVKIAWKNTLNAFEDDIEQYQEQERCMNEVLSFLKSLRPQKQEFTERDRNMIRYIGNAITCDDASQYLKEKGIEIIDAHVWLERFRPQKQWKPSEEQMEALRVAKVYPSSERREILETLYTDLEQLKAL